jgi:drug/metabolite transporter (DMT)-like permease
MANVNWFLYSVSALACLATMSFLIAFMAKRGLPISFILLGIGVVFVIYYSVQTFVFTKTAFAITPGNIALLVFVGILSAIGNFLLYQASATAPNAGLPLAIAGMQSSVVAFLAFLIFKDSLTPMQILGLVFAVIAIFLINLGSANNQPKTAVEAVKAENK